MRRRCAGVYVAFFSPGCPFPSAASAAPCALYLLEKMIQTACISPGK